MKKAALTVLTSLAFFAAPSFATATTAVATTGGTAGGTAASAAAVGGVSATTIGMGAGMLAVGLVAADASNDTTTGTVGTINTNTN